jgi:AcrR family transcriptional regulator
MPRRIDLDERREQLAEAVWATIREHGIGAVSVRTVAAEAGVAVGSLRHVFPTRSELLQFSAELMVARATQRINATHFTGSRTDVALALISHVLPLEPESRAELEVNIALIAEAPALPELRPIRDKAYQALLALHTHVVAMLAPALEADRAAAEAKRLCALVDGIALQMLLDRPENDAEWALRIVREEIARIESLDLSAHP